MSSVQSVWNVEELDLFWIFKKEQTLFLQYVYVVSVGVSSLQHGWLEKCVSACIFVNSRNAPVRTGCDVTGNQLLAGFSPVCLTITRIRARAALFLCAHLLLSPVDRSSNCCLFVMISCWFSAQISAGFQYSDLNLCFSLTISCAHPSDYVALLDWLPVMNSVCPWLCSHLILCYFRYVGLISWFSTPACLTSRLSFLPSPFYIWAWLSV